MDTDRMTFVPMSSPHLPPAGAELSAPATAEDMATAVRAKGGAGHMDFESETFVTQEIASALDASYGRLQGCSGQDANHGHSHLVVDAQPGTFQNTGHGWWNQSEVAQTLRTPDGGGSMEANIVVTPIQEVGKRTGASTDDPRAGIGIGNADDPMFTLQSGAQHGVAVAFKPSHYTRGKDGAPNEIAPPLSADADKGGQDTVVGFYANDSGNDAGRDIAPTLRSMEGGGGNHPAVAFTERTRADGRNFESQEELAYALTNPGSGGRTHSRQIASGMAVRRLTPTECERLQGFPDGFTAVDYRGKPAADGPRCRALGNSMAVPVMRFILDRLQEATRAR